MIYTESKDGFPVSVSTVTMPEMTKNKEMVNIYTQLANIPHTINFFQMLLFAD